MGNRPRVSYSPKLFWIYGMSIHNYCFTLARRRFNTLTKKMGGLGRAGLGQPPSTRPATAPQMRGMTYSHSP